MATLDIEKPAHLKRYLWQQRHIASEDIAGMQVLKGGVSNRAVLVDFANGDSWVLKQALPKLRVATEWHSDPARIEREALGMEHLAQLAPAGSILPLVFLDKSHYILAMQAAPQPHQNWKVLLMQGELELNDVRQFAGILAAIHSNAIKRQDQLKSAFGDTQFFESLRLQPYYQYSAAQVPQAAAFLERLIAETRAHRQTLVHGDYSPKNILKHQNQLILLDHEVIHWGDATFDVGFSMTHLLSKAHHLAGQRNQFLQAALVYWNSYADAVELPREQLQERAVWHTLGCLLARVAGRSPLEYLSPDERKRQQQAAVKMMQQPPQKMSELISRFSEELNHAQD